MIDQSHLSLKLKIFKLDKFKLVIKLEFFFDIKMNVHLKNNNNYLQKLVNLNLENFNRTCI